MEELNAAPSRWHVWLCMFGITTGTCVTVGRSAVSFQAGRSELLVFHGFHDTKAVYSSFFQARPGLLLLI